MWTSQLLMNASQQSPAQKFPQDKECFFQCHQHSNFHWRADSEREESTINHANINRALGVNTDFQNIYSGFSLAATSLFGLPRTYGGRSVLVASTIPSWHHPFILFPSLLISFCILRVRDAWSSRGAMYPNHISTRANPQDSWRIFTAQLKHELDSSVIAHLCKPPRFHQPGIVTPPPPSLPPLTNRHLRSPQLQLISAPSPNMQTRMSWQRSEQLLIEASRSSSILSWTTFPSVLI